MKIIPNTDCRIHILTCDFFVSEDDDKELVVFRTLPVVAWEVDYDQTDGELFGPRPITIGGYPPDGLTHPKGVMTSLLFYPHEGKYGDAGEPFEMDPQDREGAEAWLVKRCRLREASRKAK